MGLILDMGWDKPWVYGPLMDLLHWGLSLWGVVAAQAVLVSVVLWWTALVMGCAQAWRHVAVCAVLAVGSAAPWFASLIMPDIFAPLTVLLLFLLAWGGPALGRARMAVAGVLAAIAIGVHLAHLILAAGCLAVILLLRPRRVLACAAPLLAAVAWLLATNAVGNGVVSISPYGSVFALARLQADGPADAYLRQACPAAGYRLCGWLDQMPMDSDKFLWDPDGPIWADGWGPTLEAPEASRIVSATLRFAPGAAAVAALQNTVRQLGMVRLGDTLTPAYLDSTVGRTLRLYMPAAELGRFEQSRQIRDELASVAQPLAPLRIVLLVLGTAATAGLLLTRSPALRGLAAMILVGLLANAASTGALSGPHDRYQARIAWLVIVPPLFVWRNRPA